MDKWRTASSLLLPTITVDQKEAIVKPGRLFILAAAFATLLGFAGVRAADPQAVLDAELTLSSGVLQLSDLAQLTKDQLGVYVAFHKRTGALFVSGLKPGKQKVRDVLAAITAAVPLTSEVIADRDRVVICFWPKQPDAHMLAAMMKLARSDDDLDRSTAARWLEQVGGRDALVQLLKMLGDPSARVRYFAARSVAEGWQSDAIPCVAPPGTGLAVARAIETGTWRATQLNMIQIARRLRDPVVLPALKELLWKVKSKDNPRYTSSKICPAIAAIGGPEAEAILLAALDKLPERHPYYAMYGLGALGSDAALARFREHIDIEAAKGEKAHFLSLATAMAASDNPAVVPDLIRMLDKRGAQENARCFLELLARFDTPEAQAVCLKAYKTETHPAMRNSLAITLVRSPAVQKELFSELARDDVVAHNAALALASTRDPRLVPVLVGMLADVPDPSSGRWAAPGQYQAVEALGRIPSAEAEKALVALVNGKGGLRGPALSALGYRFSPEARKLLRATLEDPNRSIRERAAKGLARRPDAADLDILLTGARKDDAKTASFIIWNAVATVGGMNAARGLLTDAAKGNYAAAAALAATRDPHCLRALRNALADDTVTLQRLSMTWSMGGLPKLGAYYIASAALTELPAADEKQKLVLTGLLGWTHDPRATDALSRLLLNPAEPVALRRSIVEELCGARGIGLNRADPAAFEPMLHASEHDADERVQWTARTAMTAYWGVAKPRKPVPLRPPFDPPRPVDPGDEREFPPPPPPDAR